MIRITVQFDPRSKLAPVTSPPLETETKALDWALDNVWRSENGWRVISANLVETP